MDWPLHAQLRDGTHVAVRPIRPEDAPGLVEGFGRLSPHSRYLRFHHFVKELSDEQIRFFTELDHRDHEALVVIDLDSEELPGVGEARYIVVEEESTAVGAVAEAALTVVDAYQGRGVGTLLLAALAQVALANGVTAFRAYVLDENTAMLSLFDDLGSKRRNWQAGVWTIDFPLPDDVNDLPKTAAGQVFRLVARKEVPELDLHLPPVWQKPKAA